jgi:hypothetical protein
MKDVTIQVLKFCSLEVPIQGGRKQQQQQQHATYLNGKTPSKAWVIVGGLAKAKPFDSKAEWLVYTCCASSSTMSMSSSTSSTANVNKFHAELN